MKADLGTVVSTLEHEDGAEVRCLFTEDSSKSDSVKMPRFTQMHFNQDTNITLDELD